MKEALQEENVTGVMRRRHVHKSSQGSMFGNHEEDKIRLYLFQPAWIWI